MTVLGYRDAGHAAFGSPIDPASSGMAMIGALGGTTDGWLTVLPALDTAPKPGAAR